MSLCLKLRHKLGGKLAWRKNIYIRGFFVGNYSDSTVGLLRHQHAKDMKTVMWPALVFEWKKIVSIYIRNLGNVKKKYSLQPDSFTVNSHAKRRFSHARAAHLPPSSRHIRAELISTKKFIFCSLWIFFFFNLTNREIQSERHREKTSFLSFNLSLVPMESSLGYVRLDVIIARAHTCNHNRTRMHVWFHSSRFYCPSHWLCLALDCCGLIL